MIIWCVIIDFIGQAFHPTQYATYYFKDSNLYVFPQFYLINLNHLKNILELNLDEESIILHSSYVLLILPDLETSRSYILYIVLYKI